MLKKEAKEGLDDIYVVGCGPSLKGFNWSLLSNKTTIAINGSLPDVPQPDYFLTADSFFAKRAVNMKFWGKQTYKVIVMSQTHRKFSAIKPLLSLYDYWIIPKHGDGHIGFSEDEFSTGQNSGFSGMQLAVIFGAKRIHLLGIDLCCVSPVRPNYHNRYRSRIPDEFFGMFQTAINTLKQNNVEIISHSPISRLNGLVEFSNNI